jgi:outer membrane protein assembly factor BamB
MKFKLTAIAMMMAASAAADNWPTWRGPGNNGVSHEKNLPVHWSTTENVAWKQPMPGLSGSSPIIWGEHIFLSLSDRGSIYLWALDRTTGNARWKQKTSDGDMNVRKGNLSSPSPVTDGKTVWSLTGTGVLKAFDFSGKELWERSLVKDYGQWGLNHGYGSSPLLHEGSLYIPVLHGMMTDDPSYVVRVDGATGRVVWRVERPTDALRESPDAYTTPVLVNVAGKPQLVVSGGDYVTGHDLATGKEIWRAGGMNPRRATDYRVVASPLVHNDLIVVPTRVNPLQVFRAGGTGNISESHLAWTTRNGPDVPTPVTDGTLLYVVNDNGVVYCFDNKTGTSVYQGQRMKPATYTSSPILADGKIYAGNEDGQIIVLKAGSQFEVLAENSMDDYILSTPTISDGQIFIRTRHWLYAIGKRAAKN